MVLERRWSQRWRGRTIGRTHGGHLMPPAARALTVRERVHYVVRSTWRTWVKARSHRRHGSELNRTELNSGSAWFYIGDGRIFWLGDVKWRRKLSAPVDEFATELFSQYQMLTTDALGFKMHQKRFWIFILFIYLFLFIMCIKHHDRRVMRQWCNCENTCAIKTQPKQN